MGGTRAGTQAANAKRKAKREALLAAGLPGPTRHRPSGQNKGRPPLAVGAPLPTELVLPRPGQNKELLPSLEGPVHIEAYLLWCQGATFKALAERFKKHMNTVTKWARDEKWRETYTAAQAKVQRALLDNQIDELTRIGLRHRRGARALQRYARQLLDEGTLVLNPETGMFVVGQTGKPLTRPIGPHELQAATGAFVKAADLEYGRAGGKVAAGGVEHTFPDLVDLLDRVWKERQGSGENPLALPLPQADPRRRAPEEAKR